ncbi:hypothetical protein EDC04DRAFT_2635895, partial [Pisolithus marmoratus]
MTSHYSFCSWSLWIDAAARASSSLLTNLVNPPSVSTSAVSVFRSTKDPLIACCNDHSRQRRHSRSPGLRTSTSTFLRLPTRRST